MTDALPKYWKSKLDPERELELVCLASWIDDRPCYVLRDTGTGMREISPFEGHEGSYVTPDFGPSRGKYSDPTEKEDAYEDCLQRARDHIAVCKKSDAMGVTAKLLNELLEIIG